MMPYFVYALVDPRTDVVFYIGITNSINEQLKQHINYKDSNTEKRAWIQRLKEKNLVPSMKVLDMVVNLLASWEEFRSLRGRLGLFGVAIQCCADPRNVQISSREASKFTAWVRWIFPHS